MFIGRKSVCECLYAENRVVSTYRQELEPESMIHGHLLCLYASLSIIAYYFLLDVEQIPNIVLIKVLIYVQILSAPPPLEYPLGRVYGCGRGSLNI